MTDAPVLILPGLYSSGPEHWQTPLGARAPGVPPGDPEGAGSAGHLNGQSGLGEWPAGLALLKELRALP